MSQVALDFDLDDGGVPTYTVGELAELVNAALARRFDDGVWVRGEIQGWSERGQHAYFRLVEESDGGRAVLNVQFFANVRMKLRPLLHKHRLRLGDGVKVRIFGHLDFYAPSGQLGLKMAGLDARFTLGELALQRDEVVRRLVASGLYAANRSRPLPVAPLRIGVVTSIQGAAWADFVHELERSSMGFRVRVVDVRVQGEWAVTEITAAVRALGRADDLDAVVVIRGGGSRTELATFDAEPIAVAIASCPLPVLTGLGHEIDRSIADEVAHQALKTPTACAAALVERVAEFRRRCEDTWREVVLRADRRIATAHTEVVTTAAALGHRVAAAVERSDERLRTRRQRLGHGATRVLERGDDRLTAATASLARTPRLLEPELRHVGAVAERLRLLDPATTLARGWSLTRTADGRTVRDAADLHPGELITTSFARGAAVSRVEDTI